MNNIKWTRIKEHLIPSIMQEIDIICKRYNDLIDKIKKDRNRKDIINLFKLKKNFLLNFNNSDELNLYIRNHLLNDCINDFGIDKIIYKSKNIRKSIHYMSEREVPIK
jgi:hypothetical protein